MSSRRIKKYIGIDKKILTEGEEVAFDIYLPNSDKSAMSLFLQAGSTISGDDKVTLREIESLYIDAQDELPYKEYLDNHLQQIAKSASLSVEHKCAAVYAKAADVVENMFHNPDALGSLEKGKDLVNDFLEIILHDDEAVTSLLKITAHDYYTHTHSINVSIYTLALGEFLGLKNQDLEDLGTSALLHDLGKSKVDWEIINKNGPLSEEEFTQMKKHPAMGHKIAIEMGVSDKRILAGIRHHHEKMDGTGYPDRIPKEKISLFPRIIGVCDVFDALTTKRSYKAPMTSFEALALMKKQMSTHLDMKLVNALVQMLKKES